MKIINLMILLCLVNLNYSYFINPNLHLKCDARDMVDAARAYHRSRTHECKDQIENSACYFKVLYSLDYTHKYKQLNTKCDSIHKIKTYQPVGCLNQDLNLLKNTTEIKIHNDMGLYNHELCIDYCVTYYTYFYAVYPSQFQCVCIRNLTINNTYTDECKLPIYRTGRLDRLKRDENYKTNKNFSEILEKFTRIKQDEKDSSNKTLPRIVFLLTVHLKTERHIYRLLKTIYDPSHYYYIHVDERSVYLRKRLETTLAKLKHSNIRMTKWSMRPIWGGSSLTYLHLKAMKDLINFKENNEWDWDYVLNLSEADFPIKSVQELTLFISQHNGLSFLGFLDNKIDINSLITGQGVNWHFIECFQNLSENRMWKIAPRNLPIGIHFDGAGDWFCIHHKFVDYLINSKDELLTYFLNFFQYTIMGPETFYHTVFINSPLCDSYINAPLRVANFKKEDKRSCHCDGVIDWCGCSPPFYRYHELDILNLKRFENWPLFFARKFDPIHNQRIINYIDESIFGKYKQDFKSLNSYWLNFFDGEIDNFSQQDYKYQLVFGYFIKKSIDYILKQPVKNKYIYDFQSVDSFFIHDQFKGFVLNFNVNNPQDGNRLTKMESFFKLDYSQLLETSFNGNKYSWSNSTFCHYSHYNSFFRHLVRIEVSSDFDPKELRGKNYARILNELDNPTLIIFFGHHLYYQVNFQIRWYNPKGIVVKSSYWSLHAGFYPYDQFAVDFLNHGNKSVDIGEWQVTITAYELHPETNVNKQEDVLLKHKFLVLPFEETKTIMNDKNMHLMVKHERLANILEKIDLQKYWQFDSTCIKASSNILKRTTTIKNCVNSYWSTYYPDPKSDLFTSVSLNLDDRSQN